MKNLYFKKNNYYLVPGQTCNEIHTVLSDMKQLAEIYLSDVEGLEEDSERFEEAMIIFEFVIQKFLKIDDLDSLEFGGVKTSYTFKPFMEFYKPKKYKEPELDEEEELVGELAKLMTLMNLYEEKEEYEKCAIIKKKIDEINKKLGNK